MAYPFFYRRGSFDDEVKDIVEKTTEDAFRMAMKSMLKWVEKNMDPKKTRVFFTSMSPSHAKWVILTSGFFFPLFYYVRRHYPNGVTWFRGHGLRKPKEIKHKTYGAGCL